MGFPRQEYSSGLPFPSPGSLLHPGIEPVASAVSLALQADSLLLSHQGRLYPLDGSDFLLPSCDNEKCLSVLKKLLGRRN